MIFTCFFGILTGEANTRSTLRLLLNNQSSLDVSPAIALLEKCRDQVALKQKFLLLWKGLGYLQRMHDLQQFPTLSDEGNSLLLCDASFPRLKLSGTIDLIGESQAIVHVSDGVQSFPEVVIIISKS